MRSDFERPRPFAYWAGISDDTPVPPRRSPWTVGRLVVLAVIVWFVTAIVQIAVQESREAEACARAGGYDPTHRGSPQCVREGKPVPDSLWRSR